MPKRPRSHQLADLSVNRLHTAFEQLGWTVEILSKDYGEDLFVRLFENESATPYSFFVQAKATDHIGKHFHKKTGAYLFSIKTGHLRHWIRFAEPVFLTLYDSASDRTFWVCVQSVVERSNITEETYKKRTLRIAIPPRNLLDADGLLRMQGITKLRFTRLNRERQGAQLLIELLGKGANFKVTEYDPVNEFVQTKTDSGVEIIFLGNLAKRMDEYVVRSGLKPEEFLLKAAEAYLKKPITPESKIQALRLLNEIEDRKERDAGRLPLLSSVR